MSTADVSVRSRVEILPVNGYKPQPCFLRFLWNPVEMKVSNPGFFGISVGTERSTAGIHHSERDQSHRTIRLFCHAEVMLRHDRDVMQPL